MSIYMVSFEGYVPFMPDSYMAIALFNSKEKATKFKDDIEIVLIGAKRFLFTDEVLKLKVMFPDIEWNKYAHKFISKILVEECDILTHPVKF